MNPKHTLASSIILISILGLFAAPVMAAPHDCVPRWPEYRAERMEQNHQKIHNALKLNSNQDTAWKKLLVSERTMVRSNSANREDWAKLTTPERGEKRLQHLQEEQAFMADHVAALNDFYAVLTPEQKVVFDDFYSGPRRGIHGKPGARSPRTDKAASAP